MSQNTFENLHPIQDPIVEEDSIDLKRVIAQIVSDCLFFAICIILGLILAFIYSKYESPEWHVSSKILVEDPKNSPTAALGGSLNSDISSLFNVKSNADNEVQILKSRSLMTNVVKQMQLNVRTYRKDGLRSIETYDDCIARTIKILLCFV